MSPGIFPTLLYISWLTLADEYVAMLFRGKVALVTEKDGHLGDPLRGRSWKGLFSVLLCTTEVSHKWEHSHFSVRHPDMETKHII